MIGVDTNLLVYRHRADAPFHGEAARVIDELAGSGRPWAITWPSIHEFLAVVTHPKVFKPPTPLELALEAVESLLACPSLRVLGEGPGYWPVLKSLLRDGLVLGPRVHDGRIAAICQQHGVTELWSVDRDFSRFSGIRVVNPLARRPPAPPKRRV